MSDHAEFLLLGVANGAVYAGLAVAVVMTFRSSGVLNFATGAIALQGAYTYGYLRQGELLNPIPPFAATVDLGRPLQFWPALGLTLVLQAVLGVVLYLAVFRFLRHAVPATKAVASIGVMVVLTAALAKQTGSSQLLVAPIFSSRDIDLGGIRLASDRLDVALAVVGVACVLGAIYRFTPFGLATRAAAETETGALVSGVSPDRVAVANWALSAAVAGLAGVLIAPLTPLVPGTYTLFIVPALAAAVLGRFSALFPAVVGGLVIGMLQSEAGYLGRTVSYMPKAGLAEIVPLVLVLVVLVIRSTPLPTRGALLVRSLGKAPRPQQILWPSVVAGTVGVAAVLGSHSTLRGAVIVSLISGVMALSLVVVTGFAGQISLAQLTLAGVAGFSLSGLTTSWHVPFPIAPLLAAGVATCVGVVVGLPALRIRGLLVGVVTLTLAVGLEAVWFRNNDFNGGTAGADVADPGLFGIDLGIGTGTAYPRPQFGLLCLAVLLATGVGVAKLRTSGLGSAMLAVRANERSAAASGVSVVRVKLQAFAIGSFIAGLGGCLLAYSQQTVTFQSFSALGGLDLFTTAYLAGITSVAGAVLAGLIASSGLLFTLIDDHAAVGHWFAIVSGIGLVVTVIRNPEGIVGPLHAVLARRRRAGAPELAAGPRVPRPPLVAVDACPPSVDGPNLLSVRDLTVTYGGLVAVDAVSFDVPEGAIVGLIGPNGAGKTTTMDGLSGFVRCTGSVVLGRMRLDRLPPHRRAQAGLGRTFQGVELYDDLSVAENVVVGLHPEASGIGRALRRPDTSRVAAALEQLRIRDLRDQPVNELSPGQRQLVSVARALVRRPRLLLLDEPAAGLDSTESLWLAERLRAIRESGTTVLLIDHDMTLVLGLCDRIHVMDFGRLIASGTPDEIRRSRAVTSAYLGAKHLEETAR